MSRPKADPVEHLLDLYLALDTDQQKGFLACLTTARKLMERYGPDGLATDTPKPLPKRMRGKPKGAAAPPDPPQAQ